MVARSLQGDKSCLGPSVEPRGVLESSRSRHIHRRAGEPLNIDADQEQPSGDLSTWTVERLDVFAEYAQEQQLEAVRVVAQGHAHCSDEDRETRYQWAKLSLRANKPLHDGPWGRAGVTQQSFMLRMWVIEELGADEKDRDWNPEALAADTLAALALPPAEARALAAHWRDLTVEQIGELRRHRNLTAHLDRLIRHLRLSPVQERLLSWRETRRHLP